MRLMSPCSAVEFEAQTIYDKPIKFSDYRGKAVILCFFRDTARPLRNRRVFELTRNYKAWKKNGIEVIVVFNESAEQVKKFFSKHPRPFPVIADPDLHLYKKYGVERVVREGGVLKLLKRLSFVDGLLSASTSKLNQVGRIMPADFLIDMDGSVVDCWYGENELDHIPIDRLEIFVMAMRVAIRKKVLAMAG